VPAQSAQAKITEPTADSIEAQEMSDKAYVIRLKDPQLSIQPVVAARAEFNGARIALPDWANWLLCS
jgi:hypothetical protein